MVKQFTLGLCGLLMKLKLSLVSISFMVLQVTSGSLREGACLVELLYVTDMRSCLMLFLCRTCRGLWLFVSLIASCNELW